MQHYCTCVVLLTCKSVILNLGAIIRWGGSGNIDIILTSDIVLGRVGRAGPRRRYRGANENELLTVLTYF